MVQARRGTPPADKPIKAEEKKESRAVMTYVNDENPVYLPLSKKGEFLKICRDDWSIDDKKGTNITFTRVYTGSDGKFKAKPGKKGGYQMFSLDFHEDVTFWDSLVNAIIDKAELPTEEQKEVEI